MGQHADVRNFKDFLQLYNRITELCFSHCVDNFFNRNLSPEEGQCVDKCVKKFTQFNQRMMGVYVEVQTTINQRRLEELEAQAQQQAQQQQQQQTQEITSLSSSPQSQQENITSKILEQNQAQSIEIGNPR